MSATIPHGWEGLIAAYGDPRDKANPARASKSWEGASLTTMDLPYPMRLSWEPGAVVRETTCHKAVAPDLRAILSDLMVRARLLVKERDGATLSTAYYDAAVLRLLAAERLDVFGGCYAYRLKRGLGQVSVHSFGAAVDIDPDHNGLGDDTPDMPAWAVDAFEDKGWVWGGRWLRRDGMHFQRATGY
jgi:D-alanyl-D-alanine carboxypeptidase